MLTLTSGAGLGIGSAPMLRAQFCTERRGDSAIWRSSDGASALGQWPITGASRQKLGARRSNAGSSGSGNSGISQGSVSTEA